VAPPVRPRWPLLFVLVGGAYALGSELAFSWFGANGLNASFFPAAGVTIAALLLAPRRLWPAALAGAAVAELTLDLAHGIALPSALGYVLANVTQPLVGAILLLAIVERPDLGRTRDLLAFVASGVVAACAVGGALGASTFVFVDGGEGWLRFAGQWWVGDGLGVLVVGGAILSLRTAGRPLTQIRFWEGIALAAATLVSTALVFREELLGLVYLPIALLVVLAFRAGTRGVALTGAASAFIAAQATAEGRTFWQGFDVSQTAGLLYLQLGIGVVIVGALALAAEIAQREQVTLGLARAEEARRAAVERAALYDSEREARLRAELLERIASRLVDADSVQEVADAMTAELRAPGLESVVVGVRDGSVVRIVSAAGVEKLAEKIEFVPLSSSTLLSDTVRTGVAIVVSGSEYDRRYPETTHVRRLTGVESLIGVPIRSSAGAVIGALLLGSAETGSFEGGLEELLASVAKQCGVALERAQLREQAEATAANAAALVELGDALERATTVRERAECVVEHVAARWADGVAIELETDGGKPAVLASRGEADGGPGSFSVPLRARGRLIGNLRVRPAGGGGTAPPERHLRDVAERAAIAIDNALLYERERDVSHSLQLGLLGDPPASAGSIDLATAYLPGAATLEVGGDWYDTFALPGGMTAFVVGDVVGHGLEAAVAMGQLRGAVRALAPLGTPAELLERLDLFVDTLPEARMATLAYVELDHVSGSIRYACAGHPPPLLASADGDARYLWDGRSPPLGSLAVRARSDAGDRLQPGGTLVLYSDGLVERRTESLELGLERLGALVRRLAGVPTASLVERLVAGLVEPDEHDDDVCVLSARLLPAARFSYSLPAAPEQLAPLRHAVAGWLAELALATEDRQAVVLAISEAAANAVEHAYGLDGVGIVEVEAEVGEENQLLVRVRDGGRWREPRADSDRGRGLPIIGAIMEDVEIDTTSAGTVVSMRLPIRSGVPA
jgi:serine/threonine-protein kinase RsbW